MMTFDELAMQIAHIEAPDRHLDALVWGLVGLTPIDEAHCLDWMSAGNVDRATFLGAFAPRYTNRVNDAIALLPPAGVDWQIEIQRKATKRQLWSCSAFRTSDRSRGAASISCLLACAITSCGLLLRAQGLITC